MREQGTIDKVPRVMLAQALDAMPAPVQPFKDFASHSTRELPRFIRRDTLGLRHVIKELLRKPDEPINELEGVRGHMARQTSQLFILHSFNLQL
jgi:hypothetical protein